jgi:asparagine synthase (glutamine-hydrolysing)
MPVPRRIGKQDWGAIKEGYRFDKKRKRANYMCGITGIFGQKALEFAPAFEQMIQRQKHRGPDASGVYSAPSVLLGHNHLRILDLSTAANQPMLSANQRYVLVYNGEVFNYTELRRQYSIDTPSSGDTAVVFELLIRFGIDALQLLNGFFALAFYDRSTHQLLLARDRFGEKPLWYTHQNATLFFASELKALRSLGLDETLNRESLHSFLRFSYVPAPCSIFEEYQKLEPGHALLCTPTEQKKISWYSPSTASSKSFAVLLDEAVARRMQSDVPMGAFLSGGIDSSLVLALAKKHRPDIQAYSLGFSAYPEKDESKAAQETARFLGVKHHVLEASAKDLEAEWPFFIRALDEPFSDSSALAVSLLSRKMREHVTVALSGDGADEYLGGYRKHRAWLRLQHMYPFQKQLLKGSLAALDHIIPDLVYSSSETLRAAKKLHRGLRLTDLDRYLAWASWSSDEDLEALFPEYSFSNCDSLLALRMLNWTEDKAILEADQQLVLPNDMLVKIDLMSMANSLEIRSPFLDVHLVEKMRSMPSSELFNAKEGKIPLRRMAEDLLPASVLRRPKKGFEIPLQSWLSGPFKAEAKERLAALEEKDILDKKGLRTIQKKLETGLGSSASLVFSLMVLQAWLERDQT